MSAKIIQARISVDDRPAALLSIENTTTATDDAATYRVTLDCFRENRQLVVTELAGSYEGRLRLELIRDAFAAIVEQQDVAP
jgi:hypothetical protein